jgi:hypothetical protein
MNLCIRLPRNRQAKAAEDEGPPTKESTRIKGFAGFRDFVLPDGALCRESGPRRRNQDKMKQDYED